MVTIISIQAPAKLIAGKELNQNRQLNHSLFRVRFETHPIMNMLFRPEEVHGTSHKGEAVEPFPKADGCERHMPFRVDTLC